MAVSVAEKLIDFFPELKYLTRFWQTRVRISLQSSVPDAVGQSHHHKPIPPTDRQPHGVTKSDIEANAQEDHKTG